MPVEIGGTKYLGAAEVVKRLNVTRQTLWRWRQQGKIPAGHRYRGREVVARAPDTGNSRFAKTILRRIGRFIFQRDFCATAHASFYSGNRSETLGSLGVLGVKSLLLTFTPVFT
jgi:hypothetical protein